MWTWLQHWIGHLYAVFLAGLVLVLVAGCFMCLRDYYRRHR